MSKEVSPSQKSLKRKSADPTHAKGWRFPQVPLAKLPSFVIGRLLVWYCRVLNTLCNSFVFLPRASTTLDFNSLLNSRILFGEFLLGVKSQRKRHPPSVLFPHRASPVCSWATPFCFLCCSCHTGHSRACLMGSAVESYTLYGQP